jgi:hypothetical protein
MKTKKTEKGYISACGRFEFIRGRMLTSRNGCWKTSWRLLDGGKLISDYHEESLSVCKQIADDILSDGE